MRINQNKTLDHIQSDIFAPTQSYKAQEKDFINFLKINRDNLISANKNKANHKKVHIILPKIYNNNKKNQNICDKKKETIDDILNQFINNKVQENNKDINNNLPEFFIKNKLDKKNSHNKFKKIVIKKNLTPIEEIKRRNREIRRRKEKQEKEEFEIRQKEARKLMASFKVELDGNNKMKRKVGKRYTLFKEIMIYLESNNITLDQMLRDDPFQHQAYMLPNSYDFFNAVKYKNYPYVLQALNTTTKYLFCIDYFGQTAYHWAAKLGDLKMLKILMDYGLYHNQKDYRGRTPLYIAALNNNKEICSYLLSKGANIFLKDKNGLTPADAASTPDMKFFLSEYMTQPFSNPLYKARVKQFLIDRDIKIEKRNHEKTEENMKNNNEKILNIDENKDKSDDKDNNNNDKEEEDKNNE